MSNKKLYLSYFLIIAIIVAFVIFGIVSMFSTENIKGSVTQYTCDVKNLRFATTININCNGTEIGEVKGNVLSLVTDPLTMYNPAGDKIAYAGDAYHFIAQDTHGIYVNDSFTVDMVGQVEFFGEEYEIYDANECLVASVDFNSFNTAGQMYDKNGTLIATYSSNYFLKDFTVQISDQCDLDHYTVLMIMCSYYSDQAYDN